MKKRYILYGLCAILWITNAKVYLQNILGEVYHDIHPVFIVWYVCLPVVLILIFLRFMKAYMEDKK